MLCERPDGRLVAGFEQGDLMAAIQQPGAISPEMRLPTMVILRLVLDRRIAAHHAFADRQFPPVGCFRQWPEVGHEQRRKG